MSKRFCLLLVVLASQAFAQFSSAIQGTPGPWIGAPAHFCFSQTNNSCLCSSTLFRQRYRRSFSAPAKSVSRNYFDS